MSSAPAIEAAGVVKAYGNHAPVLDGLDLRVERGELVAIGGPSGSGKSTLLHLLAALEAPSAGSISVMSFDLHRSRHLDRFRRRQVGVVFQLHHLLPHLTAQQNVEVAMFGTSRRNHERRRRARELIEGVGLATVAGSKPPELSGGERQRVAVARALANDPPVLLADEPTGSLDSASKELVLDVIERCRRDLGTTVLLITHDEEIMARADRALWLAGGVIVPANQD